MADEERLALAHIDETLVQLRGWWKDPTAFRPDYVRPGNAPGRNEQTHQDNAALLRELEATEDERDRVQSLIMQGQLGGVMARIATLGERLEYLRQSFLALMA